MLVTTLPNKPLISDSFDRIEKNLTYTKRLQDALFKLNSDTSIFQDYFIYNKPKDKVGGDFYLMDQIQGKMICFVGDCTGHGPSGAMLTALSTSVLKTQLKKYKTLSPAMTLRKTQETIRQYLSFDNKVRDNLEGTLAFIDKRNKTIKIASSQQEIFLIGDHSDQKIKSKKEVVDKAHQCVDISLSYESGSMLYLGTDGIKDQFGSELGKKLGSKRLHSFLSGAYHKNCEEQEIDFSNYLEDWRGSEDQTDDILFMGIRLD